jgi:hypothetical protein
MLLIRVFVRGLCIFDLFNGWCDVVAGTRVDITGLVAVGMVFLRSRPR